MPCFLCFLIVFNSEIQLNEKKSHLDVDFYKK